MEGRSFRGECGDYRYRTIGDGRWRKIACRFGGALPAVMVLLQHEAMSPEIAKQLARESADNRRIAGGRVVEVEVEVYLIITES
jgi:hypothetical protein